MKTSQILELANAANIRYETARQIKRKYATGLRQLRVELEHTNQAQRIAQLVASTVQQRAHDKIASVVTRCLEAVFDEPYTFRIVFERKRGRTEANLVFTRDGVDINPIDASGGGVVDVAAFALRLSCLLLTRPPVRRILVLDEPFRFVSEEYQTRVASLLETLSSELKVQIIMVTHNKKFQIGKVIKI